MVYAVALRHSIPNPHMFRTVDAKLLSSFGHHCPHHFMTFVELKVNGKASCHAMNVNPTAGLGAVPHTPQPPNSRTPSALMPP